jgi:hypothetical protein
VNAALTLAEEKISAATDAVTGGFRLPGMI